MTDPQAGQCRVIGAGFGSEKIFQEPLKRPSLADLPSKRPHFSQEAAGGSKFCV